MFTNSETRRVRALLLVVAAAALVLVPADSAGAHALVENTSPGIDEVVEQSPARVVIDFSEPVEVAFGAIRVYDTNGNRVDDGEADHVTGNPDQVAVGLEADLPDGTYTVTWKVVSADSHPISEAFVWHVGAPGDRPEGIASEVLRGESGSGGATGMLFGATRAAMFGSLLVLVGALAFAALVWLPAASVARPEEVERDFARRLRLLLVWSWWVLALSTVASLVLQAASAGGLSLMDAAAPSAIAEVLQTRYGRVALLRVALLLGGAILYAIGRRIASVPVLSRTRFAGGGSVGAAAAAGRAPTWVIVLGALWALPLAATPGLQGHA
ncbi:MAG: copper resistance CopC family protein, partial [Actinomycetota bacterium]